MADGKQSSISGNPLKVGFAAGLVVALIGAVVLELRWPAYLALLSVVALVGGLMVAVRHRGEDADRPS